MIEHHVVAIFWTIVLGLSLMFYFLPTIVGLRKRNVLAIFVFNALLGWTFLGWVLALVWACTEDY